MTPTSYNAEQTITKCLESICNSTYKNLEIICIDDGSTDNTRHIVSSFPDKRVSVIEQENQGVSVARNVGIEATHGKYISFIDADDKIAPTMLENLYQLFLSEPSVDISGCSFTSESYDSVDDTRLQEHDWKVLTYQEAFSDYYFKTYIWGKLYKRSIIGNLRFAEGVSVGEDKIFLTELMGKCHRIGVTHLKQYYYYINPNSVMHSSNPYLFLDKAAEYCLRRMDTVDDHDKPNMLVRAYKYAFAYRYMNNHESDYKKINEKSQKILKSCNDRSNVLPLKQKIIYNSIAHFPFIYSAYRFLKGRKT